MWVHQQVCKLKVICREGKANFLVFALMKYKTNDIHARLFVPLKSESQEIWSGSKRVLIVFFSKIVFILYCLHHKHQLDRRVKNKCLPGTYRKAWVCFVLGSKIKAMFCSVCLIYNDLKNYYKIKQTYWQTTCLELSKHCKGLKHVVKCPRLLQHSILNNIFCVCLDPNGRTGH